mgnify:CR=1 FL=1
MKIKPKLLKRFLFIIFWLLLISSFCFFAFLIILKANGYTINLKSRKIIKSGMIILDGKPKNAIIYLNQEKILTTLPGKITNLFPGDYEITISYQGYKPWQKSITVLPGKASAYQNVMLFLETPENISEPLKINLEDFKNEAQNNTQEIELLGAEIYLNKRLITRFSQNITAAFVFPDKYHLVVQIENEILIIDLDGSNIQSLFKLTFKTPTSIVFRDSGKTIYYLKDDQIYGKIIQK